MRIADSDTACRKIFLSIQVCTLLDLVNQAVSTVYAYHAYMSAEGRRNHRMLPSMYGIADRRRAHALGTDRADFVERMLGKVDLVAPWTVDEFRQWLEAELQLTIQLHPYSQDQSPQQAAECGLLVIKGSKATIWYDSARSERHQRQQIFHEFAHLLCGHHERLPLLAAMERGDHPLVAGLPADLVKRAFAGLVPADAPTSTRIESEAELIGTKLAVESVQLPADGHARKRNHARVLSLWRQ